MKTEQQKTIILETLDQVNKAWNSGKENSLVSSRSGEVHPSAAYLELIRELLSLAH
jgi:hypothetical protein